MEECLNYEQGNRPALEQIMEVLDKIDPKDKAELSQAEAMAWWKKIVLPPLKDQLRKEKAATK
jgi:hypothetical protein